MSRPGLQPERTDLAWTRTALAAAGCALLLLGVAARPGHTPTVLLPALLPALLTAAAAVVLALLGRRSSAPPTARPTPLVLVGVLLTAACLTALPVAI